jgi:hypothetical protein
MLKCEQFEKEDRKTLEVFKYDVGDNGEDQMNQSYENCSNA